jgi:hypothetical protein
VEVDLSEIEFENDFCSIDMPDGNTLVINKISEDFLNSDNAEIVLDRYNIEVIDEDGTAYLCSSVIGQENDYFTLTTDYTEFLGNILTSDNIQYCRIVFDE